MLADCVEKFQEVKSKSQADPREITSLLTMILGIAEQKYEYDPYAARSRVVSNIQSDLERSALYLDDATIRAKLRQAADLKNKQ